MLRLGCALGAFLLLAGCQSPVICEYELDAASGEPGRATARIREGNSLTVQFRRVRENRLYTIWADHRSRATGDLAPDYPIDEGALPRGVAPAFSTTEAVFEGMRLDRNGVITNRRGNARLHIPLDYELLGVGTSPVVSETLSMQGMNRLGGSWLRTYPEDPETTASLQLIDPATGAPKLPRSTAQGLTIVWHPDQVTHGHTPGVGGVDQRTAFLGDFPAECR